MITEYYIPITKNNEGKITIHNSYVYHPEIKFSGNNIKWYRDTIKNHKESRGFKNGI